MRKKTLTFFLITVITIGSAPISTVADTSVPISQQVSEKASEEVIESEKEKAPPSPPPPFYKPPLRGAPEGRVGGRTFLSGCSVGTKSVSSVIRDVTSG